MAYIKFLTRVNDKTQIGQFFEKDKIYWIEDKERADSIVSRKLGVVVDDHKESKSVKSSVNTEKKIFIVHGKDDDMRKRVSAYINSLGLEPIVLFNEINKGKTIIEKIEECADECEYAVVLFSPDDEGRLKGDDELQNRARQNVVLELGYMWGKLGRNKVAILCKKGMEKPSDADGVVHIPYYTKSGWRMLLKKELEEIGILKKVAVNKTPTPPANKAQSLMDKSKIDITIVPGFLTPTVRATFPTPLGRLQAININADQFIKGTRSDFISEYHNLWAKSIPWLYTNGTSNVDVILGMMWDYWESNQPRD